MIDDSTFAAWLKTDATRCVLVEMDYRVQSETVGGSPTRTTFDPIVGTVRMSTHLYQPPDRRYFECVRTIPGYNRELDKARLGGAASISYGAVEIDNPDGQMDFLLDLACDGSQIRFYLGDVEWERSDFRLMFSALVEYVTSASPPQISIAIKDTGLLLNKSIGGDTLIGGTGPNADQPRPYIFGHVHNVTCKLRTFGTLEYVYAETGSVQDVNSPPEGGVRDEGLDVVYTDHNDGRLNLSASPAGVITADLYRQINDALPGARVSQLIDELVRTKAGLPSDQYLGAHLSFEVGGEDDYPVGAYIVDKTNLTDLLTQAADTGLCFTTTTRLGKFTFGRCWPHDIPSLHLPIVAALTQNDAIAPDSIAIERVVPTYYVVPVIVNKNQMQQSSFAGAVSAEDQARYTRQGLFVDPTVITPDTNSYTLVPQLYHLTMAKAAAQETLISSSSDERVLGAAVRWTQVRTNQFLPWTEFVEITVDLQFYYLELGDAITFDYGGRFGYDGNQLLQVCGLEMSIAENTLKVIGVRRRIPNVSELSYDDLV